MSDPFTIPNCTSIPTEVVEGEEFVFSHADFSFSNDHANRACQLVANACTDLIRHFLTLESSPGTTVEEIDEATLTAEEQHELETTGYCFVRRKTSTENP